MLAKIVIIINLILVTIIAILERKKPRSIIFWSFIILMLSLFGFLLYVVFGSRLKFRAKRIILDKHKSTKNYLKSTNWYRNYSRNIESDLMDDVQNLIVNYNKKLANSDLWHNTHVKYFYDGKSFLDDFIKCLEGAKKTINLEFYIFSDDSTGQKISEILYKKAEAGVEINIIYDAIGSRNTKKEFWNKLKDKGVKIYSFFSSPLNLLVLNLKANYRNHRKIAVIDGKIAYTGGINLRDDHMGKSKKLKPWRDTQIKVVGNGVYPLQQIFLNDLNFLRGDFIENSEIDKYFPINSNNKNNHLIQIIESGPEFETQRIRSIYLNIIKKSDEFIYIQTPYFIVDNEIMENLLSAKERGVEIKIIIPKLPDKKLVYMGTILCLKKLLDNNIKIYLYNGFIHSKVLITNQVLCIGTANFDYRSFYINFEDTCLIYNKQHILKNKKVFMDDLSNSTILNKKLYKRLKSNNLFVILLYKFISKIL